MGEECICLVWLTSNQHLIDAVCLLLGAVDPLLEIYLILQYNFKAANHLRIIPSNHIPELYSELYPRIIPPIQTSRPGPTTVKKYIPIYRFNIILHQGRPAVSNSGKKRSSKFETDRLTNKGIDKTTNHGPFFLLGRQ